MYKISELIGKQSITLLDADSRGVVAAAYFDPSLLSCKYFLLLSDEDENRYYVAYKSFSSLSNDALVIDSARSISDKPPLSVVKSPINLPAFNQDGKALGIIRDIIMDNDRVLSFVTDDGQIMAGTMLSRSDQIVVFNDTGEPIKIKKPILRQKKTAASSTDKPVIKSSIKQEGTKITAVDSKENNKKIGTPLKISPIPNTLSPDVAVGKYSFLLGKRLQRSIYSEKGVLIVKENELVTESVIQKAKDKNKLVAIALHSL